MRLKPVVAIALAGVLVLPAPVLAQATQAAQAAPAAKPADQPGILKLVVLEGEGAKNNVRAKSASAPVVEVRDESDKPVAGAEVVFQLPATGPGGVFHGWMRTQTVRSDAQGRAGVTGYTPNEEEGRFNIKVTATSGVKSGSLVIAQSNVRGAAAASAAKRRWWIPVAIIAGAAIAGGAAAAARGDNGSTTTEKVPVTITSGSVTVSGPR